MESNETGETEISETKVEGSEDTNDEISAETDKSDDEVTDGIYDSSLTDKHVRLRLEGSGEDVFALWGNGRADYRYGPSIIQNEDGSIEINP